jgi:hypothetical protein
MKGSPVRVRASASLDQAKMLMWSEAVELPIHSAVSYRLTLTNRLLRDSRVRELLLELPL